MPAIIHLRKRELLKTIAGSCKLSNEGFFIGLPTRYERKDWVLFLFWQPSSELQWWGSKMGLVSKPDRIIHRRARKLIQRVEGQIKNGVSKGK